MARERQRKSNPQEEKQFLKVDSFTIRRANEYDKTGTIFFDLEINGLTVYGCTVAKRKTDESEFVSFPSRKGADGKYYSIVYAALTQEDQDKIIDAVYDLLG